MLGPILARPGAHLRLLAIGAHADDLEIGAAGTVRRLVEEAASLEVTWLVLSGAGDRADEARRSAERLLEGSSASTISVEGGRDGYLPFDAGLKDRFERLKAEASPDLILTHRLEDAHQDHRAVSELTWQTFRDHLVLEYEIPKYEGDLGHPNLYVPLSVAQMDAKVAHLRDAFPSQHGRSWFSDETFRGLARLRSIEAGVGDGYAEAFTCRKVVLAGVV